MTTMEGKHYLLIYNNPYFLVFSKRKDSFCFASDYGVALQYDFYMNHQSVRVISLALATSNIRYKQINYDADKINNNK